MSKLTSDELFGAITGIIIFFGLSFVIGLFGAAIEQARWERMIREGKGPALIQAIQLEEQARNARRAVEKDDSK